MRISKKHDIRLNEILDAAELLFIGKGYEKATVNDILEKVEIGKGTFYHYFKSKEEVMNAVIARMVELVVTKAKTIADDPALDAHGKLKQIIISLNLTENPKRGMIEELHQNSNAQMHQKGICDTIRAVAPILADVIIQGVKEGVYRVEYPLETIEFLLAANQLIFDEGIMKWTPKELWSRAKAFVYLTERALGAQRGSFDYLIEVFQNNESGGDADEQ